MGSLLGPFPTIPGSPNLSPPAWVLDVQLLGELTWQLTCPRQALEAKEQTRMASLAGCQLTSVAALCPGGWPEKPGGSPPSGTWPPTGGGTKALQSAEPGSLLLGKEE